MSQEYKIRLILTIRKLVCVTIYEPHLFIWRHIVDTLCLVKKKYPQKQSAN